MPTEHNCRQNKNDKYTYNKTKGTVRFLVGERCCSAWSFGKLMAGGKWDHCLPCWALRDCWLHFFVLLQSLSRHWSSITQEYRLPSFFAPQLRTRVPFSSFSFQNLSVMLTQSSLTTLTTPPPHPQITPSPLPPPPHPHTYPVLSRSVV
jgi:hypothetical protein